jgi:hypothetical protein
MAKRKIKRRKSSSQWLTINNNVAFQKLHPGATENSV